MNGLSSSGKERIKSVVERLFDSIAFGLLGNIPSVRAKHTYWNAVAGIGLGHIFIEAMGNRRPNSLETDVLSGLLASSHGYIESIKHNTQSNVAEQVDGLVRQAKLSGSPVNESDVHEILANEMKKARNQIKLTAESESTKIRNIGSVMDITKKAAEKNIEDPNVFFIVVRDSHTCEYCKKNHINDDGTPKVFKLSEIKQSYLSTEEKKSGEVSVCGAHPLCRCTLSFLSPGYGFKRGKLEYISHAHDEYINQRS